MSEGNKVFSNNQLPPPISKAATLSSPLCSGLTVLSKPNANPFPNVAEALRDSEDCESINRMLTYIYTLDVLVWEYMETIADLCAHQHRKCKDLTRKLRSLQKEAEKLRHHHLFDSGLREEKNRAGLIDEWFATDFDKQFYGLDHEISRMKLPKPDRDLLLAVQQALSCYQALTELASEMDPLFVKAGLPAMKYAALQKEIIEAARILPEFCKGFWPGLLPSAKLSGGIIAKRVKEIDIKGVNGPISKVKMSV